MQGQVYDGFYARFLGGFSLRYREKEILIGMGLQSRPVQFLLLLIKAGDKGAERKDLLALVQNVGNDQKRQLNNFYQHMHILREMILELCLPEGKYIVLRKGRYYFTTDHRVRTDIGDLDGLIGQLKKKERTGEGRRKLCKDYCRGYGGEFLPQLAGEGWVTIEGAFYQRWYGRCLEELYGFYKEEGRYEEILELSSAAGQLHPYDGWQAKMIESLLALGRYKEAEQVYREASQLLYGGLGANPLDQVMAGYRQGARKTAFGVGSLVGLEKSLWEEDAGAPYHCSYPSFQDTYRIIARMGERQESKGLLLLCTLQSSLTAGDGRMADRIRLASGDTIGNDTAGCAPAEDSRRAIARKALEREMLRLKGVLVGSLRTSDVYTRYSENQYLALLVGAGTEDGENILTRLERDWRSAGGRDMRLDLEVQQVESSTEEVGDGERDIRSACRQPGEFHLAGTGHMAG